eukprot:15451841-Alexandrium_andersonii.AAC.1
MCAVSRELVDHKGPLQAFGWTRGPVGMGWGAAIQNQSIPPRRVVQVTASCKQFCFPRAPEDFIPPVAEPFAEVAEVDPTSIFVEHMFQLLDAHCSEVVSGLQRLAGVEWHDTAFEVPFCTLCSGTDVVVHTLNTISDIFKRKGFSITFCH